MSQNVAFNPDLVKNVAHLSPTAENVFRGLLGRTRTRKRTDLKQFERQLKTLGYTPVIKEDFVRTFKALEEMGAGSIIEGRGTKPPRFDWTVTMKDLLAKVGQEPAFADVKPLFAKKGKKAKKVNGAVPAPAMSNGNATAHAFTAVVMLRPSFPLRLSLPIDFSAGDIHTLSALLAELLPERKIG